MKAAPRIAAPHSCSGKLFAKLLPKAVPETCSPKLVLEAAPEMFSKAPKLVPSCSSKLFPEVPRKCARKLMFFKANIP
jgi:hypothetical protein